MAPTAVTSPGVMKTFDIEDGGIDLNGSEDGSTTSTQLAVNVSGRCYPAGLSTTVAFAVTSGNRMGPAENIISWSCMGKIPIQGLSDCSTDRERHANNRMSARHTSL